MFLWLNSCCHGFFKEFISKPLKDLFFVKFVVHTTYITHLKPMKLVSTNNTKSIVFIQNQAK